MPGHPPPYQVVAQFEFLSRREAHELVDGPLVFGDASGHRWGPAEGLMIPAEVVGHEVKRDGVGVVLDLLAERVGQPRVPPHPHPHRQVLPLDVARRDQFGIRRSVEHLHVDALDARRRVAASLIGGRVAVLLDHDGVVDAIPPKRVNDGRVAADSIGGQLDPVADLDPAFRSLRNW